MAVVEQVVGVLAKYYSQPEEAVEAQILVDAYGIMLVMLVRVVLSGWSWLALTLALRSVTMVAMLSSAVMLSLVVMVPFPL
jgi:hypothetical protein